MLDVHDTGTLASERQRALVREAAQRRETAELSPATPRETVAAALIALAVWLAPSMQGARPGRRPAINHRAAA